MRKPDGKRILTSEVLLNTRHVAELIERGEVQAIKEAMEQIAGPVLQTFEQDLFRSTAKDDHLDEALANADSPTNLSWLINNSEFGNDKEEEKTRLNRRWISSTKTGGTSFRRVHAQPFRLRLKKRPMPDPTLGAGEQLIAPPPSPPRMAAAFP